MRHISILSIRHVSIITVIATFLAFTGFLVFIFAKDTEYFAMLAYQHEQEARAGIIGAAVANALERGDFEGLKRVVDSVRPAIFSSSDPDILSLSITGDDGEVFVRVTPPQDTGLPRDRGGSPRTKQISTPLRGHDGRPLGRLDMVISFQKVDERILSKKTRSIVIAVLLCAAFVSVLIYLFQKNITNPVSRLSEAVAMQASRAVPPSYIPFLSRRDEIGTLARVFHETFTDLARANEDLEKSRQHLQAIMDNSPAVVTVKDREGRFLFVNRMFERLFGVRDEDIRGRSVHDIFPAETARHVLATDMSVFDGRKAREFEEIVPVGEKTYHFLSVKFVLPGPDDLPHAICTISTDITRWKRDSEEKYRLELQLKQAQKLESIGQLAGGIAHDFNNMLTGIIGFSSIALRHLEKDHPARPRIESVIKTGERAAGLTQQLLAFSRKQMLRMEVININDTVMNMGKMLNRIIGDNVSLEIRTSPSVRPIRADATQIDQIIMNLAVNARDAMPEGGRLLIKTDSVHFDEQDMSRVQEIGLTPGDYVVLSVRDTGEGMTPEVRAKIFEPFFTTKGPGKGTGLGLSTVYGIVKQHGGAIEVESSPGEGTVFYLYFPVTDETPPKEKEVDRGLLDEETLRGSERIMIVDDESLVLDMARITLESLGYRVMTASDGMEAHRLLEKTGGLLDLLITDILMPGLGGPELAREVRAMIPSVRIIFITGYAGTSLPAGMDGWQQDALLQKPLTPAGLATVVRKVLDGETGPDRLP